MKVKLCILSAALTFASSPAPLNCSFYICDDDCLSQSSSSGSIPMTIGRPVVQSKKVVVCLEIENVLLHSAFSIWLGLLILVSCCLPSGA